jgi:hypothetical protein
VLVQHAQLLRIRLLNVIVFVTAALLQSITQLASLNTILLLQPNMLQLLLAALLVRGCSSSSSGSCSSSCRP